MDLHNVTVTACRGAFSRDVYAVNLGDWLSHQHFMHPNKKAIDCIMPHGEFNDRTAHSLIMPTGLIQVDIDDKVNDWEDWDEIVEAMGRMESVAYAAISCSGKGIFCLVNAYDITQWGVEAHAKAAEAALEYIENAFPFLELDEKVSRNLASLRFAPFNKSRAYWNLDSKPLMK